MTAMGDEVKALKEYIRQLEAKLDALEAAWSWVGCDWCIDHMPESPKEVYINAGILDDDSD